MSIGTLLTKKEGVYDEIKLQLSGLLVRKITLDIVQEQLSTEERDYFIKCLVVGLNFNDNAEIRQNITSLLSNLLTPIWAK